MKFYLITDDTDALTGMHLAGIEGVLISSAPEAGAALKEAAKNSEIGILLVTNSVAQMCPEEVKQIKLCNGTPLLVEIPNSDGSVRPGDSILKIVHDAIGM